VIADQHGSGTIGLDFEVENLFPDFDWEINCEEYCSNNRVKVTGSNYKPCKGYSQSISYSTSGGHQPYTSCHLYKDEPVGSDGEDWGLASGMPSCFRKDVSTCYDVTAAPTPSPTPTATESDVETFNRIISIKNVVVVSGVIVLIVFLFACVCRMCRAIANGEAEGRPTNLEMTSIGVNNNNGGAPNGAPNFARAQANMFQQATALNTVSGVRATTRPVYAYAEPVTPGNVHNHVPVATAVAVVQGSNASSTRTL